MVMINLTIWKDEVSLIFQNNFAGLRVQPHFYEWSWKEWINTKLSMCRRSHHYCGDSTASVHWSLR